MSTLYFLRRHLRNKWWVLYISSDDTYDDETTHQYGNILQGDESRSGKVSLNRILIFVLCSVSSLVNWQGNGRSSLVTESIGSMFDTFKCLTTETIASIDSAYLNTFDLTKIRYSGQMCMCTKAHNIAIPFYKKICISIIYYISLSLSSALLL